MKQFVLNLGVALFSVFFALLLIEGSVRVFDAYAPVASVRWASKTKEFLPAVCGRLRGSCPSVTKAKGTYRVAVVGDSFTYGANIGVDDNFVSRLQRYTDHQFPKARIEFLNFGIQGYSTREELQLVQSAITKYHADMILLQMTLNDADPVPYQESHKEQIQRWNTIKGSWIVAHSRVVSLVLNRLHVWISRRSYLEYFRSLYQDGPIWNDFTGSVRSIRAFAAQQEVPLVAVVFPLHSYTVNDQYPFRFAHMRIKKLLRKERIPRLDLQKPFVNIPHERLEVEPGRDAHPNEIAHRIAADSIFGWLKKHHILPPPRARRAKKN